jgi:hypothetical protein
MKEQAPPIPPMALMKDGIDSDRAGHVNDLLSRPYPASQPAQAGFVAARPLDADLSAGLTRPLVLLPD